MQQAAPVRPQKSTNVRINHLALRTAFRTLGATAPGLAARLAERVWATPPRAPLRPEQRAVLDAAARLRLASGGAELAVWSWGEGPAALLVHGWGGHAGQLTPLVRPLLARGLRVLAFDAPGHGETRGGEPNLVRFAAAIAAVGRLAGGVRALAAHSLGAAAASYAMHRHPAVRPDAAVFFAPAADMTDASRRFAQLLAIAAPVRDEMQRRFERRIGVTWDQLNVPSIAPAMRTNLLVVHDEGDREVPVSEGAAVAAAWPGATFERTSGLGHHRIVRDERVVARAAAFLADPPAAQPMRR